MKTKFWILIICVVAILCVTLPGSFADPDVAEETSAATEATEAATEATEAVTGETTEATEAVTGETTEATEAVTGETTADTDNELMVYVDVDGAAAISLEKEQEALELFARLISCQSREELEAVLNTTTSEKTETMFECLPMEKRQQFIDLICTYMPEMVTVTVEVVGGTETLTVFDEREKGEQVNSDMDYEIKPFTNVAPFVDNEQE